MSSDRPVRTNCYVRGHLGGSNCPQCRAEQQPQPLEQPQHCRSCKIALVEDETTYCEHCLPLMALAELGQPPEQPSPASAPSESELTHAEALARGLAVQGTAAEWLTRDFIPKAVAAIRDAFHQSESPVEGCDGCDDPHCGFCAFKRVRKVVEGSRSYWKHRAEQAQQRIAELEKQLKAATSCFGRYGKIEFDVLESRAEQAEAERDALNKQVSACVFAGCDVGYNAQTGEAKASNRMTIERDVMKAERDALKARLQQLEGALREYVDRCPICNSGIECQDDYCYKLRALLTPPAAGEEG